MNKYNNVNINYLGKSVNVDIDNSTRSLINNIENIKGVKNIVGLIDLHVGRQETPTSIVVESQGYIIPSLCSNVINCGIGLIDTGLNIHDIDIKDIEEFIFAFWEYRKNNIYNLNNRIIENVFLKGIEGLIDNNIIDENFKNNIEFGGKVELTEESNINNNIDLDEFIPKSIRLLPITKSLSGWNLKGNHFLEFQVVNKIFNNDDLNTMGLDKNRIMIMVHTDFKVTGAINYHYVIRKLYRKKNRYKRLLFYMSKVYFHYLNNLSLSNFRNRHQLYFRPIEYLGFPLDSPEGKRYINAYNLCTNYAYAGRSLFYKVIIDLIKEKFKSSNEPQLIWDSNHESMRVINSTDPKIITRKGAVQSFNGKPAIIAGNYNVDSFLGICEGDSYMSSYDHGSSHLQKIYNDKNKNTKSHKIYKYELTKNDAYNKTELFLNDNYSIKKQIDAYRKYKIIRPVALLRPFVNISE